MEDKQEAAENGIEPYKQPEWVKIILQLMKESKKSGLKQDNESIEA